MLYDCAHAFLVITFAAIWALIGHFAFIKYPKPQSNHLGKVGTKIPGS